MWWYQEVPEIPKKTGPACDIGVHKWKPILLLYSEVYNCEHCNIKKEDWEKKQNELKEQKDVPTSSVAYWHSKAEDIF